MVGPAIYVHTYVICTEYDVLCTHFSARPRQQITSKNEGISNKREEENISLIIYQLCHDVA